MERQSSGHLHTAQGESRDERKVNHVQGPDQSSGGCPGNPEARPPRFTARITECQRCVQVKKRCCGKSQANNGKG